ncbi:hypothetical protein AOCH_007020, partial [Aspergillus ochraceoroseus]
MDQYPYYSGQGSQQHSYSLYGLNNPNQSDQGEDLQGNFNSLNYQPYDPNFHPAAHSFGPPSQSPSESYSKQSTSSNPEHINQHQYSGSVEGRNDFVPDPLSLVRSSSEEKEGLMTPAQSKRKAQNRAAQRAFRERKERHVRELEEKVTNLQQESTTLLAANERMKRELARYTTENEILRATSSASGGADGRSPRCAEPPTETGPMAYSPTDFYSSLVPKGKSARLHRVMYCSQTGERLLDAQATWDLIQSHEQCQRGLLDIADVTARLKAWAQCDGQGPAFRESQVRK